ncbi:MAG: phosphoribosylamine--glycine ligase [Mailhella sp.]|nr:phosphoribosylamine--glycine ligase [Mailhella sp.]
MRILVIGSGGREHALIWKLSQSPLADAVFAAPGNGGTAAHNVPIKDGDIEGLVRFAVENKIDLVVPGPELPLTLGISDAMAQAGIACFGPSAACAKLEGSKAFAKSVMKAAGVPTADCGVFSEESEAAAFINAHAAPMVVKADGLAAGKGVIIAATREEALEAVHSMLSERRFGDAGNAVLIEEFLTGEEVSLICFCDGERAMPLPSAQDHKAAYDGDIGPNTGGMGAYSPAPIAPDSTLDGLAGLTVRPILREMARRGTPYKGILYAGLMMTDEGPKVLEYNVRFGDPECQPLLSRLAEDIVPIMLDCVNGTLAERRPVLDPRPCVGVVLTAEGYPGSYEKGMPIDGIEMAETDPLVRVFQAGTAIKGGKLVSSGGRVLTVAALGDNLAEAKQTAYAAIAKIRMPKSRYRSDIADKGIRRLQRS